MKLLDVKSKNRILFDSNNIYYKGRIINRANLNMRYFKFYMSIVNDTILFPKLIITGNDLYVICYFSRRDIKKLKELGYEIKMI